MQQNSAEVAVGFKQERMIAKMFKENGSCGIGLTWTLKNGTVKQSNKDYSGVVASRLCAAAIYDKDSEGIKFLLTWTFTEEQAERICEQATACFTYDEFRDVSKQLIVNVVSRYAIEPVCLSNEKRPHVRNQYKTPLEKETEYYSRDNG